MDGKSILKWGLIIVVAIFAWRILSGAVSGLTGSLQVQQQAYPQWGPNYYSNGVYGSSENRYMGSGDPFYSSSIRPSAPRHRRTWSF